MKVPLLLLADYVNVAQGNKLNIMGVFTTITADAFPYVHPSMMLVAQFRADPTESGDFKLALRIMAADGERVFDAKGDLTIPNGKFEEKNIAQLFTLNNVKFPKPGEYAVVGLINGEERQRYTLWLQQSKGAE